MFKLSKLINIEYTKTGRDKITRYRLICPCGKEYTRTKQKAHENSTCKGCSLKKAKTKHGMAHTGVHNSWHRMIERCTVNRPEYSTYKKKGIKVCDRWLKFENFYEDMGDRPIGTTLDRIDNNGNYEPGNCRWASIQVQKRNTSLNHWVEYKGQRYIINDLAKKFNIYGSLLIGRLKLGWDLERALTAPPRKIKPSYLWRKMTL